MLKQGYSQAEIFAELTEIVDNARSDIFDLTDNDIVSISDVFYNDDRFDRAFKTALMVE